MFYPYKSTLNNFVDTNRSDACLGGLEGSSTNQNTDGSVPKHLLFVCKKSGVHVSVKQIFWGKKSNLGVFPSSGWCK